ncbi:MAG: HAMP domain-containing histidine kinase [Planctomycetes bacterium]|nr:HAMP domain-containing histidine kinase [Planctomycetota bacterium]
MAAQRQDRIRVELDGRAAARDLAVALRAVLRHPGLVDAAPPEARFVVRDGAVQCDADVGYVLPSPDSPPDAAVAERLRRAQIAEFAANDPDAATREFDELLGPGGPTGERRLPILAAAAWQAHRAGDAERSDALAARLEAGIATLVPAAMADRPLTNAVVAAALLARARGGVPSAAERLLPTADPVVATPALARLAELGADTHAPLAANARIAARRALLRRVVELLPTATAGCQVDGTQLLAWFPGPDKGGGHGAWLPREWLRSLRDAPGAASPADLPPLPRRGELVFGGAGAADADEVLPGIDATPGAMPEPHWLVRPATTGAAGALLVAVFVASAFLMLRAVRREAMATRARTEFLTGVTHELKTPVAAIRLLTDVLRDDDVPADKQREYFGLLAGEATRLSMLIDNVLDLGQMERGERAYDLRPGDLADAVHEAVAAFAPLAERAGLGVTVGARAEGAPATFDRGAVVQALLAVLENARKYAADGRRIDVATTTANGSFVAAIRDHGPGVPPDERERVFARFERGTAHRHGTIPGIGLGLHIARSIVERHGGTLVCMAPRQGPGAEFVFSFPLDPRPVP